jgi:hypothetical protein
VLKADINRTLAEIAKYPKKNHDIIFIEDRVKHIPTWGAFTTPGGMRRHPEYVGQYGDLGQFSDYLPENIQPSDYVCYSADTLYAMEGTGGVGFLALTPDGKLLRASNCYTFSIPGEFGTDFTLYSVDADNTLHEIPYAGSCNETVTLERAGTLPDSLSQVAIKAKISGTLNGTDIAYLRKLLTEKYLQSLDIWNAYMVAGGQTYYGSYRTSMYALGDYAFHGCSQLRSIDLPERTTSIGAHALDSTGISQIRLPQMITSVGDCAFERCAQLTSVGIGPKVKTIGRNVFNDSPVKDIYVTANRPPQISSGLFNSNPVIHVYAKSLSYYQASDWAKYGTIVGDLEDYPDVTALERIVADEDDSQPQATYNLLGQPVGGKHLPRGIYIRHGRKFLQR